jgi:hypothetical protein
MHVRSATGGWSVPYMTHDIRRVQAVVSAKLADVLVLIPPPNYSLTVLLQNSQIGMKQCTRCTVI